MKINLEEQLTEEAKTLNLRRNGFVAAPEENFSDDGSYFRVYYYDPDKTGDKRFITSKLISDGQAYISVRYKNPETGKGTYFDDLNGVDYEYAIQNIKHLTDKIDKFKQELDAGQHTAKNLSDEEFNNIVNRIVALSKKTGDTAEIATKKVLDAEGIDEYDLATAQRNTLKKLASDTIRNSKTDNSALVNAFAKQLLKNVLKDIEGTPGGYDSRGRYKSGEAPIDLDKALNKDFYISTYDYDNGAKALIDAGLNPKKLYYISDLSDAKQEKIRNWVKNKVESMYDFIDEDALFAESTIRKGSIYKDSGSGLTYEIIGKGDSKNTMGGKAVKVKITDKNGKVSNDDVRPSVFKRMTLVNEDNGYPTLAVAGKQENVFAGSDISIRYIDSSKVNERLSNLKSKKIVESDEGDKIAQDAIDSKNANFEKDKEAERQAKVELAKNGVDKDITESKKGFVKKYKNCSIHDTGDTYTITNQHGKTIGSNKTILGAEGFIDDYVSKEKVDESKQLNETGEWDEEDYLVVYPTEAGWEATSKSNKDAQIQDARKIQKFNKKDGFNSKEDVLKYINKYFGDVKIGVESFDEAVENTTPEYEVVCHSWGDGITGTKDEVLNFIVKTIGYDEDRYFKDKYSKAIDEIQDAGYENTLEDFTITRIK